MRGVAIGRVAIVLHTLRWLFLMALLLEIQNMQASITIHLTMQLFMSKILTIQTDCVLQYSLIEH